MTTRRHIVLLVLPVFVSLALMGGVLMAWVQLSATIRDFQTEVRTLAVAVRVAVDTESREELTTPSDDTMSRLPDVLRRILHWEQVHRIQITSDEHGVVFDSASAKPTAPPPITTPGPDAEGIAWHPLTTSLDGRPVQAVSVEASARDWHIHLEVDATTHLAQRNAVWRAVTWFAAACLVVGLVASLMLAHFVAAQFSRLADLAKQVDEENFDPASVRTHIQEIADVSNSLAVMHSVIRETVERGQRALENSAPPPTDHLATQVFREDEPPLETWTLDNVNGAIVRVGNPLAVTSQARTGLEEGFAFVGVMPDDKTLETTLRARAAQSCLTQALRRHSPDTVIAEIMRLFDLPELVVLHWQNGTWRQSHHRTTLAEPTVTKGTWRPGEPVILAGLGAEDRKHLRVYQTACARLDLQRLVADLPVVLRGDPPGLVTILQTDSSSYG